MFFLNRGYFREPFLKVGKILRNVGVSPKKSVKNLSNNAVSKYPGRFIGAKKYPGQSTAILFYYIRGCILNKSAYQTAVGDSLRPNVY